MEAKMSTMVFAVVAACLISTSSAIKCYSGLSATLSASFTVGQPIGGYTEVLCPGSVTQCQKMTVTALGITTTTKGCFYSCKGLTDCHQCDKDFCNSGSRISMSTIGLLCPLLVLLFKVFN